MTDFRNSTTPAGALRPQAKAASKAMAKVIGQPIAHSRSPRIHAMFARAYGSPDFSYGREEVAPDELAGFVARARSELVGFNVTLPHKTRILPHLDSIGSEARAVGAVNTVLVRNGSLHGENTDVEGVRGTLADLGFDPRGTNAWVIGAGGAARAVAYALGAAGTASVEISNRTTAAAEAIVSEFADLFPRTRFRVAARTVKGSPIALVVQATSLGIALTTGDTEADPGAPSGLRELLPPDDRLSPDTIAFDVVYRLGHAGSTPFLRRFADGGRRTVDGLPMLVHQAFGAFKSFVDRPSLEADPALFGAIETSIRFEAGSRAVCVSGFMGAGKSTVGPLLALALGAPFIDLDERIAREAGAAIPELFAREGEASFRLRETRALESAFGFAPGAPPVIALGGGTLSSAGNRARARADSHSIHLDVGAAEALRRIGDANDRPLLRGLSESERLARVESLLLERAPAYAGADVTVDTAGRSPSEIVIECVRGLGAFLREDKGARS